jgi:2-hydroxymuconate-semialdehyde hydrolase
MRSVLDLCFDRTLVNDELAELRFRASTEPGMQEAFSSMFPAPRQRWVESMTTPLEQIAALPHETLIIHGRDDRVIPLDNAWQLLQIINRAQLHVFGRCGHWTQIEHAKAFNNLLLGFLRN